MKNFILLFFMCIGIFAYTQKTINVHKESKNSGSVKIDKNGDNSEPTFTGFSADVLYQILYVEPILDAETYYPETSPTEDTACIYNEWVTVGVTTYRGIYLENPVLGQPQIWRVSISYSGKSSNVPIGLKIILKNPISGFERALPITLPASEIGYNFLTFTVPTYHDKFSAQPPIGSGTGGYQFFISSTVTDNNLQVIIKDIARLTYKY